jgi:hypothetical protein
LPVSISGKFNWICPFLFQANLIGFARFDFRQIQRFWSAQEEAIGTGAIQVGWPQGDKMSL